MSKFKHETLGEKTFTVVTLVYLVLSFILVVYPIYFIISASFSDPELVSSGQVWLFPKGITLEGYRAILEYKKIWVGFRNTIFYTVAGTFISVVVTLPAAYSLSRKDFMPRNIVMIMFVFTMFFTGGLIPTYLVISKLNLIDTIWVMIIPFSLNVYNLIIARTYFQSTIPGGLQDAAAIDGCGDFNFFMKVVLPLSKPIIAVVALYYGVFLWNSYFMPMIYIRSAERQALQVVLRDVLIQNEQLESMTQNLADIIKYGVIIISALPMIAVYPFVQKYFVKGVMIGSVKG